jgi:hypothetical protein
MIAERRKALWCVRRERRVDAEGKLSLEDTNCAPGGLVMCLEGELGLKNMNCAPRELDMSSEDGSVIGI